MMWPRSAMASQLGMLVLHTATAMLVLHTATAAADEAWHSSTPAASSTAAAHGAAIYTPALFFVSPTGSDEAAGTSAAHPFATIEHALSGARGAKAGATITLLDGLYPLRAPVRITGADAGPGRPLTLQAHQGAGARPVLSGGASITGWIWDSGAGLWRAPMPAVFKGSTVLRQLWVGGERLARPTISLGAQLNATTAGDLAVLGASQPPANQSKLIGYVTGDPRAARDWAHGQVEGVFNGSAQEWCEHRCTVARTVAINASHTLIVMTQPCFEIGMRRSGWSEKTPTAKGLGVPNYWENVHAALAPAEWCLNMSARTVDYMPVPRGTKAPASSSPEVQGAVAPLLEMILHVVNATNVVVRGLGLEHSAWHLGSKGYISSQ